MLSHSVMVRRSHLLARFYLGTMCMCTTWMSQRSPHDQLCAGTVQKNHRGFPDSLGGFPKTFLPERGTLAIRMHHSRKICAICWVDSKPVFLLSTATSLVHPDSVAGGWVGRQQVDFPTSSILLEYQSNMRRVDVVDQKREYYSVAQQGHKWWHRALYFVIDLSLNNSFSFYSEDQRALGLPLDARHRWHYLLGHALIQPYLNAQNIGGAIRNLAPRGLHWIQGHPTNRGNCVVCGKRIRRYCGGCGGVSVYDGACFVRLHTQARFRAGVIPDPAA
jgi:hypothetical protein